MSKGYKRPGNYSNPAPPDPVKRKKAIEHSNKGYYQFAFGETFRSLTERDIELRQEYAKDLIARYYNMHKKFISFRKKTTNQSGVVLDEVFYVRVGKKPIGKVSLRVSRLGKRNNLFIAYQHKNNYESISNTGYKTQNKRQARRNRKRASQGQHRKNKKTY